MPTGTACVGVVTALHDEADGFAVACLEATQVRAMHARARILLLEGCFEVSEYRMAAQLRLDVVLHSVLQVEQLLASELAQP